MPDIERKFLRVDGVQHAAGCEDVIGKPCTCGAEMRHVLEWLIEDAEQVSGGLPEEIELAKPEDDFDLNVSAGTIRAVRQALANQRARRP